MKLSKSGTPSVPYGAPTTTKPSPEEKPQLTREKRRGDISSAPSRPLNFIHGLPGDVLNLIIKKLDDRSEIALSLTDKAALKLHAISISKRFDKLLNDIFKEKPSEFSQAVFNKISEKIQHHKIINLSTADKLDICRFFERNILVPEPERERYPREASKQVASSIIARHLSAKAEASFFPDESHSLAQRLLNEFSDTFNNRPGPGHDHLHLHDTQKLLESIRKLPHPELFIAKLYRSVQTARDTHLAHALTDFLATIGSSMPKGNAAGLSSAKSPQKVVQELKILQSMLHAATPISSMIGNHPLSERLPRYMGGTRAHILVHIQEALQRKVERIEARPPVSLKEKINSLLKPHTN